MTTALTHRRTGAAFEEYDPRPGSVTSLLRTFVGAHLRTIGGEIAVGDLVALLGTLGCSPVSVRTAVARAKKRELLLTTRVDGAAGYRLNPAAGSMLERGDRRIFGFRQMRSGEPWSLVTFTVPEGHREDRHRLRKALTWLGYGTVSAGVWIAPGHLIDETESTLEELGLRAYTTVFPTETPRTPGALPDAVRTWWDLDLIRTHHEQFLGRHDAQGVTTDEQTFVRYVRALDAWRPIPYLDPGLDPEVLPADWPGPAGAARFAEITAQYAERSLAYVRAVTRQA